MSGALKAAFVPRAVLVQSMPLTATVITQVIDRLVADRYGNLSQDERDSSLGNRAAACGDHDRANDSIRRPREVFAAAAYIEGMINNTKLNRRYFGPSNFAAPGAAASSGNYRRARGSLLDWA